MKAKASRILAALSLALICASMSLFGAFGSVDTLFGDALYQQTSVPSPAIHVIGVDEPTLQAFGPFASWSREKTAALIRTLNADPACRPAVIAVDIIFESEANSETDVELVAACEEYGNVILATQSVFQKQVVERNGKFVLDTAEAAVMEPFPALKEVALLGHVNTALGADGAVRTALYSLEQNGKPVLGLSSAAAELYCGQAGLPLHQPPMGENGRFPIRYTAKPGAYFGGNSFIKVLSGEIPAARFAGDIVFVGAYAAGMMDAYLTPIDPTQLMNGVEIHANIADAQLSGRYFRDIPAWVQAAVSFVAVFFCAVLFFRWPVGKSTALFAVSLAAFAGMAALCAGRGVRIQLLYIPGGIVLSYASALVAGYAQERKRRAEITGVFKQYVSPDVVDGLLAQKDRDAIQNRRRDITVMFLDIRSFTSLSESLEPEELVELLNEYLSLVTRVSFQYGGTIDKFLGDGAMVLFNAPLDQPGHELCAIRAARQIVSEAWTLSEKYKQIYGRDVMLGIGVHCGHAIVGSIGTQYRMDYTAIGDTVNTASRLQGKAEAGDVVISDALYSRLKGRITVRSIGSVGLKGKAQPMQCFCVLGIEEELE